MKWIRLISLFLVFLLCSCSYTVKQEGDGSEESPYLIHTVDQLKDLSGRIIQNSNFSNGKYFKLMNDLDFKNKPFTPIGKDLSRAFCGVFDGNGHTIKNIAILDTYYEGVFGVIDGNAIIKNLSVENIMINNSLNRCIVGGIVGQANKDTEIIDCHTTGSIYLNMQHYTDSIIQIKNKLMTVSGGIAGFSLGKISNCSSSVEIKADSAGGIAGMYSGYGFSNNECNNTVIYGSMLSGGLIGIYVNYSLVYSKLLNNYVNYVTLEGEYSIGGAVGGINGFLSVEKSSIICSINVNSDSDIFVGGVFGEMNLYWLDHYGSLNYSQNRTQLHHNLVQCDIFITKNNKDKKAYVGYFNSGNQGRDYVNNCAFIGSINVTNNCNLCIRQSYEIEDYIIQLREKNNVLSDDYCYVDSIEKLRLSEILGISLNQIRINEKGDYEIIVSEQ